MVSEVRRGLLYKGLYRKGGECGWLVVVFVWRYIKEKYVF